MAGGHHGCLSEVSCYTSQKKKLRKWRGQGPGAKDLPEGRILLMMMMLTSMACLFWKENKVSKELDNDQGGFKMTIDPGFESFWEVTLLT